MAKYFVCSDIHGAESRLESALTRQSDIDTVVVCGDLEMEVYDVEEIIRRCTSRSIDIRMVRGNCDSWFSSSSRIPDQITLTFNTKHKALVMHSHLYRASSCAILVASCIFVTRSCFALPFVEKERSATLGSSMPQRTRAVSAAETAI